MASLSPPPSKEGVASPSPLAAGVSRHTSRAKAMLEAEDYAGAVREGSRALDILPDLAEVAVVRAQALLCPRRPLKPLQRRPPRTVAPRHAYASRPPPA